MPITPPPSVLEETALAERKRKCIEKGGTWDEATQTCKLPTLEEGQIPLTETQREAAAQAESRARLEEEEKIQLVPEVPEVAPTPDTDPREIFTPGTILKPGEVVVTDAEGVERIQTPETLAEAKRQEEVTQAGVGGVGVKQLIADATRKLNLAAQVGQIDFQTAMELDELGINWREAFLKGGSDVIPGALQFGAIAGGAALVSGVGAPVAIPAAIVGAAFGAIKSFYSGVTGSIKAQKGDLISGKRTELKQRQRSLQNYISAANANPASADEMTVAFNTELSLIRKDYNTLNKEANEDLTLFGGQDGTPQLIAYEIFFESIEPSLVLRMEQAILKPDPTRAYLTVEDLE